MSLGLGMPRVHSGLFQAGAGVPRSHAHLRVREAGEEQTWDAVKSRAEQQSHSACSAGTALTAWVWAVGQGGRDATGTLWGEDRRQSHFVQGTGDGHLAWSGRDSVYLGRGKAGFLSPHWEMQRLG